MMQLRAVILVLIGAGVIIYNKILLGKHHFKSLHAKVGLLTLILTLAAPIIGAISFKKWGLIHRFPERYHATIKRTHRALGVITWLLALATIQLALPHKSVHKAVWTPIWQAAVALCAALMGLLLWRRPSTNSVTVLKIV
eukprot:jgi/Chrzof1/5116/Cz15g12020.t1